MSTRERWIVYPLLFMTLGIALRDKVLPPNRLAVGTVVCNRLQSNRAECNTLLVNDPAGRPVVVAGTDANTGAGTIETLTPRGTPQVRLFSTDTGGMLTTIGHGGKVLLVLGHVGPNFGVFAQLPELGPPIPLTFPWKFEAKHPLSRLPRKRAASEKPSNEQPAQATPGSEKQD